MSFKKIVLLLFFIFLFLDKSFCQKHFDEGFLQKKIKLHEYLNNDSLIFYAKKLQSSKNLCYQINGLNSESKAYYNKKDYSSSEKISKKALEKLEGFLKSDNLDSCLILCKITSLNRLFWIHKNLENHNAAYDYLLKLDDLIESPLMSNNKRLLYKISIEFSKSLVKNELKMEEDSKKILLNLYDKIENNVYEDTLKKRHKLHKTAILNSIGETYKALGKKYNSYIFLDSAQFYFDKSFEITKSFKPQHKDSEILYTVRTANVLIAKKKFKEAIKLTNTYASISNGYDYYNFDHFQKAICFYNLYDTDSTLYYVNKVISNKKLTAKRSNLIAIYDILSNLYYRTNKVDSAYKYSKLTLKEYNNNEKLKEKTYQLLYKNDFEKAQNLNKLIQKKDAKNKNALRFSYFAVGLFSFMLVFYFFSRKKWKKEIVITNSETESTNENQIKTDYNIDKELEKEILKEIDTADKNLEFLKIDFSVNYLAEKLNTNSTYISYVFNKNKNETFKQYYNKKKIEYLVNKLKTDIKFRKYSIQGLAEEIGYTNASAFSRAFKKHIGTTPTEFLKTLN